MDPNSQAYLFHKLRGPLAVIKSALSLVLEGRSGEVGDEAKKFLGQAYQKTEELISFLDEMEMPQRP